MKNGHWDGSALPGGPGQGTSETWAEGTKKSIATQNIVQL